MCIDVTKKGKGRGARIMIPSMLYNSRLSYVYRYYRKRQGGGPNPRAEIGGIPSWFEALHSKYYSAHTPLPGTRDPSGGLGSAARVEPVNNTQVGKQYYRIGGRIQENFARNAFCQDPRLRHKN